MRQCFAHRRLQVGYYLPLKTAFVLPGAHAGILKNALSRKVAIRRVMLMQRVNRDTIRRCAGGASERVAKCIVPFVSEADPIYRTEYDRVACPEQHRAPCAKGQIPLVCHWIKSHVAADRRCRIDVERGQAQARGFELSRRLSSEG